MALNIISGSFFFLIFFPCKVLAQDNLSLEERLDYHTGRAIFEKIWVSSPSSTAASDGLGPLYNARSCAQCHEGGGRGLISNSLVIHLDDAHYGQQLQKFSIVGQAAEAKINVRYSQNTLHLSESIEVTLQVPEYFLSEADFTLALFEKYSPRIASSLLGLGLIELIPEQAIAALEDADDSDNDGVSGRQNWRWDDSRHELRPGRFGWKAGQVDLAQQAAKALNLDMGISSALYPNPYGDCTLEQVSCLDRAHGNSPRHDNLEASGIMLDSLLFYLRNISPPVQVEYPNRKVGEKLFNESGCSTCHYSHFEVAGEVISAYSDFLLHDLGEGLADGFTEGLASGSEWRTAPLWGLGQLSSHEYLHDGRAKSLEEAILWHGGEALNSVAKYRSLSKSKRETLIRFLNSL